MDIEEFKRRFGLRVQALRKRRQLTQEDLAEQIGRSVDTVSNVERGASSTRIETAFRMAEVLGVEITDLFEINLADGADRQRRQLIERLVDLVSGEDDEIVEAIIAQAEILLRVKAFKQPT